MVTKELRPTMIRIQMIHSIAEMLLTRSQNSSHDMSLGKFRLSMVMDCAQEGRGWQTSKHAARCSLCAVIRYLEESGWVLQHCNHCCKVRQVIASAQHFSMRGIHDIEVGGSAPIARPSVKRGIVVRACDTCVGVALRTAPTRMALASVVSAILSPEEERFPLPSGQLCWQRA